MEAAAGSCGRQGGLAADLAAISRPSELAGHASAAVTRWLSPREVQRRAPRRATRERPGRFVSEPLRHRCRALAS
ncbi:hypothetical protein MTO96_003748 [Rhipicephalus appendiculatus]